MHEHVTCDGCGIRPIIGSRFKCSVRSNYDLCENCEQNKQPFPMIKIYNQSQTPNNIVVVLRNKSGNGDCGLHRFAKPNSSAQGHRKGWGHKGPHGQQCSYPQTLNPRIQSFKTGVAHERWTGNLNGQTNKAAMHMALSKRLASVAEEADQIGEQHTENSNTSAPPDAEDMLMQQALAESLIESSRLANTVPVTKIGTAYYEDEESLSGRCMSRFVNDCTFPDGTQVVTGTNFTKVWLIRNTGTTTWPAGVSLVTNSGDMMCSPLDASNTVSIVGKEVQPNEEVELSVQLTAPEHTGHHIAYFRLCSPDGTHFGQELWCDIVVVSEDPDICGSGSWDVLASDGYSDKHAVENESSETFRIPSVPFSGEVGVDSPAIESSSFSGGGPFIAAMDETFNQVGGSVPPKIGFDTNIYGSLGDKVINAECSKYHSNVQSQSPAFQFSVPSEATVLPQGVFSVSGERSNGDFSASSESSAPLISEPSEVWSRVWATELRVLSAMGFMDVETLIPLLQQHVGLPVLAQY